MKKSNCFLSLLLCASVCLPLVACSDDDNDIPANQTPYCQRECTKADDCCATPPCDQGADAEACISGICKYVGCSADTDCKDPTGGAMKMTMKCEKASYEGRTVGACVPTCASDSDCPKIPILNIQLICKELTYYGKSAKTCVIPCSSDADCSTFKTKCKNSTYCDWTTSTQQAPGCKSDADCASSMGETKCDVSSGECYCESDQACTDAYKATGHTYKCLK